MFRHLSLRFKLMLPILFFMTAIFIGSQWFSISTELKQKQAELIERVQVLSKGVAYNLQIAVLFGDSYTAQEILSAFAADSDVVRVKLFDNNEQLTGIYESNNFIAPIPNEAQRNHIRLRSYVVSKNFIYLRVPIIIENEKAGFLRVTISKQSFDEIYQTVLYNAFFFFVLLLVCGITLYLMVQKLIVDPVFSLNQAMCLFIEHRERKQLVSHSDDEIGELVTAFNTMLDRLEKRETQVLFTLDKLEQEKSFANEVVETVQHALIVVNDSGVILHFNGAANHVFKCTPGYLKGENLLNILNSDEIDTIRSAIINRAQLDEQLITVKDVFQQLQLLQLSSRALSRPGQMLFAIQDVTDIEAALSRQRLAARVFENSQDGLMVINQDGVITMVNPAVTRLLGYPAERLVNHKPSTVLSWQQFTSLMPTIISSVMNYGQWQGEIWEQHQNGTLVPMFVKVNRITRQDNHHRYDFVFMLSDLSNLKEMERLEHLAHHDSLTGLANRAHLYRRLDEILVKNKQQLQSFSLLYLDLDGFKQVNDTHGHDAGDEVLKQVAERLLSQVRSQDMVARLSGDEFVLVVIPSDRMSVALLAQRLLDLLTQNIVYHGKVLQVGVSIGVYFIDDANESLDSILKAADSAMYMAKSSGKGRYILVDRESLKKIDL